MLYANSEKALNINEQRATIIAIAEDNADLTEEEYRRLQEERYKELKAGEGQEDSGRGKGRGRGRGRGRGKGRGRGQKQIEENESNEETSTTIKIATQENPIPSTSIPIPKVVQYNDALEVEIDEEEQNKLIRNRKSKDSKQVNHNI